MGAKRENTSPRFSTIYRGHALIGWGIFSLPTVYIMGMVWRIFAPSFLIGSLLAVGCAPEAVNPDPQPSPSPAGIESAGADQPRKQGVQTQFAEEPLGVPAPESGWKEEVILTGLNTPWGMDWLPDGRMIFTEKRGRLTIYDPKTKEQTRISGLPEVAVVGQGGLMDVSLHPDFAQNSWVYLTLSQGTNARNHTVLARGKLSGDQLTDVSVIFKPNFLKEGGQHFGSRILWLPDKTLLLALGDGGNPPSAINGKLTRHHVQEPDSHLGKVLRLDENGKAPKDNPFLSNPDYLPEIFSLGHRNVQGLAYDPNLNMIWQTEHGALGGDELNVLVAGKNYGWPLATFSKEYSGRVITDKTSLPGMVSPVIAWTPCPAPCGLTYYTGDKMPNWKGDLFSGGLAGQDIRRIELDGDGKVVKITQLRIGNRVRNVQTGPDGYLYFATDQSGARISRIVPAN